MMTRVCKYCKKEKPIEDFFKEKGYYSYECKECHKKRRREYYAKNRDHVKAKSEEWKANNKDKVRQYNKTASEKRRESRKEYLKEYNKTHSEQIQEAHRLYYQNNKEELKKKNRERYESDKEVINKKRKIIRQTEEYKEYVRSYKERNRERILSQKRESNKRHSETYKKWAIENEKELAAKRKVYYEEHKEKIFSYIYKRKKEDPLYKLKFTLRCRIYSALKKKGWRKNGKTESLLGADYKTVKHHIESLFEEGMNWENHGEWHIDHIIPLASAKTENEVMKLFHYTNLQPLWAEDNLRKSDKIIERVE